MMLNFAELIRTNNLKIKGIIQLGVHFWQEKEIFKSLGVKDFVLVEPQQVPFKIMYEKTHDVNAVCFNCAVSDKEGYFDMNCDVVNESQSSSLLEPKEHLNKYPTILFPRKETVQVKRIENLEFDRTRYNVLCMDLQGAELLALKGAGNLLNYIDAVYTEVNFIEMYEGCVIIEQLDEYLSGFGFKRVATGANYNNQGWSDAFYLKNA